MFSTSNESPAIATPQRGALRIALIYIAVALLWITGSDGAVVMLVPERYVVIAQMIKGYAFVLLTGYLLYVAIARLLTYSHATRQRLTYSDAAYRQLFESHPNPMYIYAPETLRFLAVNRAALDKYGYTRDEFFALTLRDMRPPELIDEFNRELSTHNYFDEFIAYGPVRHWTKERRLLDMLITSNTLEFEGNRHARVVLAQDVTERTRAERALRESQNDLREVQRIARLGWWSIARPDGAASLSEHMQQLIAFDGNKHRADFETLFQRVHRDDRAALQQAYARVWKGVPMQVEVRVVHDARETVELLLRGDMSRRADGANYLIGTALDISARKQHERNIQQSEIQYRQLVDLLPEAVIVHCDARVIFANPAALALFGVTQISEIVGVHVEQFIAAPSKNEVQARFASLHRGAAADTGFQERLLKKINGEVFTAEVAAQFVVRDGRRCVQAVVRDIGAQKKTQLELQRANERLLHLSAHMVEAGEDERRQLSRELHDDLGQSLTFIKMTAAWLRKRVHESELTERIDQLGGAAGDALDKVRNLALALRPAQLDALGLKAAMEEHLQRFCAGSGITYAMQLQELAPRPTPAVEIALFRIFQEAVTNIFRHSGANFIELSLTRQQGAIVLRVVDDGRGFDVAAALSAGARLGLHTMHERAQQLRGSLQLHSVAGVGTELVASIPEPSE